MALLEDLEISRMCVDVYWFKRGFVVLMSSGRICCTLTVGEGGVCQLQDISGLSTPSTTLTGSIKKHE